MAIFQQLNFQRNHNSLFYTNKFLTKKYTNSNFFQISLRNIQFFIQRFDYRKKNIKFNVEIYCLYFYSSISSSLMAVPSIHPDSVLDLVASRHYN